jgi:hypothetical protein
MALANDNYFELHGFSKIQGVRKKATKPAPPRNTIMVEIMIYFSFYQSCFY